jgi:uncharacterized protein YjiS (DUF1127 family)
MFPFPSVGTWEDLGFNSYKSPTNPNYWPFRQHLRSRCSLTRSSDKGLQDIGVYNQRKHKVDPRQQHTSIELLFISLKPTSQVIY